MSTPTVDVNQAFATERATQIANAYEARDRAEAWFRDRADRFQQRIADGNMRDNGDGTFTVTGPEGSYDIGEVFRLQAQPDGIPLVLPQSGLDLDELGRAQLYTAVPTWHSLEGVGLVEGGTTDIDQVLTLGGINWLVMQEPVTGAISGEFPGAFINYRSDNKFGLGVVGKIYTPIHPRQQLGWLQDLAERYDIPFESAGPLNGGKQVFVSMRMPEPIIVDQGGLEERTDLFMVAFNDNTGNGQAQTVATPWRPICGNTNRFALRDAVTRWGTRHTKGWQERAEEARRQLGLAEDYAASYAEEATMLARAEISLGEVDQLLAELGKGKETWAEKWAAPDEASTNRSRLAYERRLDAVFERFGIESARVGRSAWALENAVTGFTDHDQLRRGRGVDMTAARATAALAGADDAVKAKVHKLLLARAA